MYNFVFDADALIKLAHSGSLNIICKTFQCVTTSEVKREVVDEGKKRLYSDAEIIEELIVSKALEVNEVSGDTSQRLGKGEMSVFSLSKKITNSIVISDDRTFIKLLEREGIDFLTPSDVIILLREIGKITNKDKDKFANNIKSFVSEKEYKKIMEE